jgi:hypothetical protein
MRVCTLSLLGTPAATTILWDKEDRSAVEGPPPWPLLPRCEDESAGEPFLDGGRNGAECPASREREFERERERWPLCCQLPWPESTLPALRPATALEDEGELADGCANATVGFGSMWSSGVLA